MKRIFISSTLILIFGVVSFAQEPCTRHAEASGGFSYCPPLGWSPRDSPSQGFKSFFPPAESTLKANMNMKTEVTTVTHETYMMAALRKLLDGNEARGAEARKIIGWTPFTTDSNLKGSRMVYELLYKGAQLRTVQVVLDLPGKKLILTGTALNSDKDTTDKIFDAVAKSIAVGR